MFSFLVGDHFVACAWAAMLTEIAA